MTAAKGSTFSGRVLVVGATGTTGKRLAGELASRGVPVTAAARAGTPPRGITGVRFDWYDPTTYSEALAGVDRMYLIPPVPDANPEAVMVPFLEKAREAGVRRAVLHSNIVVPAGGPGTGIVHDALPRSFDDWAVIRPSWFMQNVIGDHVHARSIRENSAITTATDDARVGFIDASDIAKVAAAVLLSPAAINTDLIVTGPQTLSYTDVAAILTESSGHLIRHVKLGADELREFYIGMGLSDASAQFSVVMDSVVASGTVDYTTDTVERVTASAPHSFAEFATAEFRW